MNVALKQIERRMPIDLARTIDSGSMSSVDVRCIYDAPTGGEDWDDYDPNLESTLPTLAEAEVTHKALMHTISPEAVVQRGFTEIRAGDVIFDFLPDTDLTMRNLRMEVHGKTFVAKEVGKDLSLAWDVTVGGARYTQTLLATMRGN